MTHKRPIILRNSIRLIKFSTTTKSGKGMTSSEMMVKMTLNQQNGLTPTNTTGQSTLKSRKKMSNLLLTGTSTQKKNKKISLNFMKNTKAIFQEFLRVSYALPMMIFHDLSTSMKNQSLKRSQNGMKNLMTQRAKYDFYQMKRQKLRKKRKSSRLRQRLRQTQDLLIWQASRL